ncbi:MAG: HupE/UreJ family protein, partial [Candidatus Melainabacteria bacterium]|nr:HupE/UreJ family protein [Candidatus Melainabacteria bacterium]
HSITLSLAALEIVVLPSRFVESAIAFSVLLAALNNLFSFFKLRYWMIAFAFGLIHGFGFASVLLDLGLPKGALLLALVGFNIGVEIGQLAIVSVFLPIAYYLRNTVVYKKIIFMFGSLVIAAIALLWFVERVFNMEFMPF